ncbi:MAG: NmrA family NAD(P)-binding protein [Myxococcales bacterium]|nr:NmrA family NAD(P)-binding protein [Myxococcales bacterium]
MNTAKPIIAVFGATGRQGGGVVRALQRQGMFRVRAITRDARKAEGLADEVVEADLRAPETLAPALAGAHGVFLVTNFWAPGADEKAEAEAAIAAAKQAGVAHLIWSTLPDVEAIAGGRFDVAHFTTKANVDAVVRAAGFPRHTFVEAPFYYQNLAGVMRPQPQADGSAAWTVPMDPDARVLHMGDIDELGSVVAGAFANPERVGDGQHLAHAGDLKSWSDLAAILNEQGHNVRVQQVPGEVYDGFYPGAVEMRHMMQYFAAHTYFGPEAAQKIERAREVATQPATSFADWAREHLQPGA